MLICDFIQHNCTENSLFSSPLLLLLNMCNKLVASNLADLLGQSHFHNGEKQGGEEVIFHGNSHCLYQRCSCNSSHLKADLYFIFNSLLQDKGLLLKGFQVSCWKQKRGGDGNKHRHQYFVYHSNNNAMISRALTYFPKCWRALLNTAHTYIYLLPQTGLPQPSTECTYATSSLVTYI